MFYMFRRVKSSNVKGGGEEEETWEFQVGLPNLTTTYTKIEYNKNKNMFL